MLKFEKYSNQLLSIPTKKPCSKCGRGLLILQSFGRPLRVCSGCKIIEENCKCERKKPIRI